MDMGEKNTATNNRTGYIFSYFINVILLVIVIALLIAWPREKHYHGRDATTKSNIHFMQIALERYAEEHAGFYPLDLNALVHEGFITQFPGNPFSDDKPIRNIPFCTPDSAGNFTYVPLIQDCNTIGFYLLCYGAENRIN